MLNARPVASIVIPARDEAMVIERTLRTLLVDAAPGEFDVIVVPNGCSDDTPGIVRRGFPGVRVIELAEGSKTMALNTGLDAARAPIVLLLDADVRLGTASARALVATAGAPGVDAAIARMEVDRDDVAAVVRAFYAAWLRHPYFDGGKFAAAYALSTSGRARLGRFPAVTADDEYAARRMQTVRTAPDAYFRVAPPRTLAALLAVRTRSRRGTAQLSVRRQGAVLGTLMRFAGRLLRDPRLWPAACVYAAVRVVAGLRVARSDGSVWERDLTSRTRAL
ncbi:MAG: glycosyltransferase [Pseudomonadales bacterium]|nr:glycosyltransferase [Pseudomonadales bacterium]